VDLTLSAEMFVAMSIILEDTVINSDLPLPGVHKTVDDIRFIASPSVIYDTL
jgi:hypothetical protein